MEKQYVIYKIPKPFHPYGKDVVVVRVRGYTLAVSSALYFLEQLNEIDNTNDVDCPFIYVLAEEFHNEKPN